MLKPDIDDRGFPSAVCRCDVCGRETRERAKHERGRKAITEGQVLLKLQGKGWTFVKNVLRCPSCEADRKSNSSENAMTDTLKTLKLVEPKQAEPSREQKRQIMSLLDSVYDTSAGRYTSTDNDQSVADALGAGFKIDWVSQIREEFFGPDGNDTIMIELAAEMAEIRTEVNKAFERSAEAHKVMVDLNDRLNKAVARLEALTGARK